MVEKSPPKLTPRHHNTSREAKVDQTNMIVKKSSMAYHPHPSCQRRGLVLPAASRMTGRGQTSSSFSHPSVTAGCGHHPRPSCHPRPLNGTGGRGRPFLSSQCHGTSWPAILVLPASRVVVDGHHRPILLASREVVVGHPRPPNVTGDRIWCQDGDPMRWAAVVGDARGTEQIPTCTACCST
jgi:hypothetical protein